MAKQWFVYSTPQQSVVGNNSATANVRFGVEDFELHQICGFATAPKSLYISFKITDKGMVLSNSQVLFSSIVGNSDIARPYTLPVPLILTSNSNLEVTFTDISGSTNIVNLDLIGYKIK